MARGRQSRGRQRIPMKRINTQDDLYATFSKRRLGLYKKASELSTLCAADVGVIIFSPTNNPFSFWHPSVESVIGRYRNPDQPLDDQARVVEANTRARIEYLNMRLDEVLDEKENLKDQEKQIDENEQTQPKGWWEEIPVESLCEEQVKEWKAWFKDLDSKVKNRIDELEIGASNFPAPSMFATEPSYEEAMRMIRPSHQFLGYQSQEAPIHFYGDGTNHVPGYYYHGIRDYQFPGLLDYFPLQAQDPLVGGAGAGDASTSGIKDAYPSWRNNNSNP